MDQGKRIARVGLLALSACAPMDHEGGDTPERPVVGKLLTRDGPVDLTHLVFERGIVPDTAHAMPAMADIEQPDQERGFEGQSAEFGAGGPTQEDFR